MWRGFFSRFRSGQSRSTARRGEKPHRVGQRQSVIRAGERLEARWYLSGDPIVQVNTNGYGSFQLDLFPADAPQTVANFLSYVDSGKYDNLVVSRSIPGFIIQAGGITSPTATYSSNSQFVPVAQNGNIPLEYKLPNTAYTLAMARQNGNANSGSDEWFINLADNTTTLAPGNPNDGIGYTVFGQVVGTSGQQIVNTIAAVPTKDESSVATGASSSTDLQNMPLTASNQLVQITSMTLLDGVYGTVFTDTNANGKQDTGETGVANRTVFVNVDGTGKPDSNNPSATTDASGSYYIAAVPAGSYQVEEVLPSGVASSTSPQSVTFATSSAASNVNLGETVPSISGNVFADFNGNGKLDSGDPGIANQTVFLNNDKTGKPDSGNPSTTTDANGNFSFTGLAAGTYNVMVQLPSGVTTSTNTQSITVSSGKTATANIGELPSLVGIVFNDLNVSGKFATGDPGVAGVTVFLNNDNTGQLNSNPSTTTDANGHFYFMGLAAGSYTVDQVLSPNHGVTVTTPAATATVTASQTAPPSVTIGDVLTSPIVPMPVNVNTSTPPSNADAAYIDDLYFTLLGHHADASSLSYWEGQLSGGATRTAVAQAIWNSPEHRGIEVDQYYHTYLNRAPEPTGRTFWINRFASGGLTERLATNFFTISPEYQTNHSSDSDYISALYQDQLLRTASASDISYWTNAISSGETRNQVATAIVNGQEPATRIVDDYYANFLHRMPDAAGAQSLINDLVNSKTTAEGAAIGILATDEYFNLAGKAG